MTVRERIARLRELMAERGLAAYYVPSTDPHQSEYVAATWQRRGFISGFDGSAGTVVVTMDKAGLWTDSRYFLQAEQQLAGSGVTLFKMGESGVPEVEAWLASGLSAGQRVGLDAKVVSMATWRGMAEALDSAGVSLDAVPADLVEQVWGAARPPLPDGPLKVHSLEFAGETVEGKLARVQSAMAKVGADAHVLGALDEAAWLFNLRGSDVAFNPVFIAYGLVNREGAMLFVDLEKVNGDVRDSLPASVVIRPYRALDGVLQELGAAGARVWLDTGTTNQHVANVLSGAGASLVLRTGPVASWKAAKNPSEIAGIRAAHLRDGVAMVRFLKWLDDVVPAGGQTELSIGEKVEYFRSLGERFVGMSFNSIVGYGAHGAIVHYGADEESNVEVKPEGILLVDSGGQYLDGTTDITRTLAVGPVSEEQKSAYTAVLKGHLNLGRTLFVAGTNGYQLDVLARAPLWSHRLNYGHGTGHGVGAYLCVHEGPFSVSLRRNMTPLEPGQLLSNEPGFYKTGEYGMRIENLVLVVDKGTTESGTFYGFEDITLCPYDRRLIDVSLLSETDRKQVNEYHKMVYETLTPLLDESEASWLREATREL